MGFPTRLPGPGGSTESSRYRLARCREERFWLTSRSARKTGSVMYTRVSSADRKADPDRQVARLTAFATQKEIKVAKVVAEIGSGLNDRRGGLISVLRSPEYGVIFVERRERHVRLGSEYIEAALVSAGRRLIVMEPGEVKDDRVQDMIDVLTTLCTRLYGPCSARQRAEKAVMAPTKLLMVPQAFEWRRDPSPGDEGSLGPFTRRAGLPSTRGELWSRSI